ncbi:MAG: zinc ribbon domain-containing protein [Candidatus Hodarchaeales archaeon]|jgi:hypothetical protein
MEESSPLLSIEGSLKVNSEIYSARDIIQSLLSQGVSIKKIGSTLRVGQKILAPLNSNKTFSTPGVDPLVANGLETQISRIFSEITKLKQHLGLLENNNSDPNNGAQSFTKNIDAITNEQYNANNMRNSVNTDLIHKWDSLNSNPNRKSYPANQENVPFYTFGTKKKNSSIISEFQDITKQKGLSDNDVLDDLSSRVFASANQAIQSKTNNSLRSSINRPSTHTNKTYLEKENVNDSSSLDDPKSRIHGRCTCGTKIPSGAKFCQRCGKRALIL